MELHDIIEKLKNIGKRKKKTVMALSITKERFYSVEVVPGQDPRFWSTEIEAGVVDDNGYIRDVDYMHQVLQEAIQRLGKPESGIAIIPDEFCSLHSYQFDETGDKLENLIQQRIMEDNPFIVPRDDNSFSKEPIAVLRQDIPWEDEKGVDVVVNIFPQKIIDSYQELLSKSEIPLGLVGTTQFSLFDVFYNDFLEEQKDKSDFLLIVVNERSSDLTIWVDNIPVYQRNLTVGFQDLKKDSFAFQMFVQEIDRSVEYYQRRIDPDLSVQDIYVISNIPYLADQLTQSLADIRVTEIQDGLLHQVLESYANNIKEQHSIWISLLNTLKENDKADERLFTHKHVIEAEAVDWNEQIKKWAAKYFPHVAVLLLLTAGAGWAYQNYKLSDLKRIVSDQNLQLEQLESIRQSRREIEALRVESQNVTEAVRYIKERIYYYPEILDFIVKTLPADIVLNHIQIQGNQWAAKGISLNQRAIIEYIEILQKSDFVQYVQISQVSQTGTGYSFDMHVYLAYRGVPNW